MPKIWSETIEEHRRSVQDAILESAWTLVNERGLRAVTMTQIAERSGIGRATLYKYFSSVEGILLLWHERQVSLHLKHLVELGGSDGTASERLGAILEGYAQAAYFRDGHAPEIEALLHRGERFTELQQSLNKLIGNLLTEAANSGEVRKDIEPDELLNYCLHSVMAARRLHSVEEVKRLVNIIMRGLSAETG